MTSLVIYFLLIFSAIGIGFYTSFDVYLESLQFVAVVVDYLVGL